MAPQESPRNEESEEATDWTDTLAYGGDSEAAVEKFDGHSEHWSRWHYGVYLSAVLLVVGLYKLSLTFLVAGYLLGPITMYLDSQYLEDVTTGWQPDVGLYLVGTLLFPVLIIPAYLYKRRELRGP